MLCERCRDAGDEGVIELGYYTGRSAAFGNGARPSCFKMRTLGKETYLKEANLLVNFHSQSQTTFSQSWIADGTTLGHPIFLFMRRGQRPPHHATQSHGPLQLSDEKAAFPPLARQTSLCTLR